MSSKNFLAAMKNARESKSLDTVLHGSGANYLPEGTHDVSIIAVDSSKIEEGKLSVTYADESGKQYRDMTFLMNSKQDDFSFSVKALWASTIPSKSALDAFFKEFESGNSEAFNMLTGMKLRVTLGFGPGFIVKVSGQGKYAAYDQETGVAQTEEYDSIQEARDAAEAKGLKRSYLRIKKAEATNGEANVSAFLSAVSERQKATSGNGGVIAGNFAAGTKTPSFV